MDEHDAPLPWDASLLDAERAREGPTLAQQDALLARLERSIDALDRAGATAESATAEGASPTGSVASARRRRTLTTVLTYLLGIATGAGGLRAWERAVAPRSTTKPREPSGPRTDTSHAPLPAETTRGRDGAARSPPPRSGPEAVSPPSATPPPSVDRARRMGRSSTGRPLHGDENALWTETHMIEMARSALARGRAADALEALDRHRRQFAQGQLVEDRESLAIEALVTLGRYDEARRRGEGFLRRWPESVHRPRVDTALRLLP